MTTPRPRISSDHGQALARNLYRHLQQEGVSPEMAERAVRHFHADLTAWSDPEPFTLGYTGWRGARREKVQADLARIRDDVGALRLIVGFDPDKRRPSGGDMHAYDWAIGTPGVTVECLPAP
ncbi:hypothetical protein B0I32_106280 [Nonomuraea fuscirosea]|uniref:Uncharacterized protein n=1 Tax=Nonomuraea fuscirosea TaxID=1291556 RepID=A0A2T0N2D8_9ACTN|nr:hypothetical protein [Nonomuraea fuscirosea]PRX66144.1 hypothetical protein B0I32_106280 [Nonomuraea fuscirosea]